MVLFVLSLMADATLPDGYRANPDPVEGNPFRQGDPRHRIWEEASRIAEERWYRFCAQHLEAAPQHPSAYPEWVVKLTSRRFDIWAERGLAVVWSDAAARAYDQWLVNYADSCLQSVASLRREQLADPLPRLGATLAARVSHWKADARGYLAEQPEHNGGLTNADVLNQEAAERQGGTPRVGSAARKTSTYAPTTWPHGPTSNHDADGRTEPTPRSGATATTSASTRTSRAASRTAEPAAHREPRPTTATSHHAPARNVFRKAASGWEVSFGGQSQTALRDLKE